MRISEIAGYAYHFGQETVCWSLKKQQIIALSTVEAEYVAQAHAAKEALWLRAFVSEIRNEPTRAITINCDNQGAIALSKDNNFHSRTKHINVRIYITLIWHTTIPRVPSSYRRLRLMEEAEGDLRDGFQLT